MSNLTISSNGHYLKKSGSPFLWISETVWYMVQRASRDDVRYLLDRLAGITNPTLGCTNVIKTSIVMRLSSGEAQNPTNANGHQAFNGGTVPDFTSPKIVAGGTPDTPKDYWDHLDFIVRETKNRGMYLMLLPQWASAYVHGDNSTTPITVDAARSHAEFLGNRYKNETNIIWMLGGDGDNPTVEGTRPLYEAQAEGLLKGITGCTTCPAHDEASPLWNWVTMLYHGYLGVVASSYWDFDEKWMNVNGAYAGRFYTITPAYNLANPRPIVETEGYGYWISTDEQLSRMRFHQYTHILSGGRGPEFMNEVVWNFEGGWKDRLSVAERVYITIFRDVVKSVAWYNLIPDQGIIKSANSFSVNDFMKTIVASRSSDTNLIIVYFGALCSGSAQIDLSSIASHEFARGTWIDPKTGATQDAGSYPTSSSPTYSIPSTWTDAVLKLEGSGEGTAVISQAAWTLKYVSSEETEHKDQRAIRAFDGDSNTFWHTRWVSSDPSMKYPHEIQINLGDVYVITGFRCLPRQDKDVCHIKGYGFYTSYTGTTWTLAASGQFSPGDAEKEVTFPEKTGQYIKLIAISSITGDPGATIAELNVLGAKSTAPPPPEHLISINMPKGAALNIDDKAI